MRDYPDNPERFAFLSQAALDVGRIDRAQHTTSSTRTTGRPDSCRCMLQRTVPAWRGPVASCHGLHDPQPRVSGSLRRELAAAARPRMGPDARGRAGVLGPHQLPEGRHRVQRHRSRPSAPDTPRRSRRRSSGSASTASCARVRPIWSAFSTESITISGIRSAT